MSQLVFLIGYMGAGKTTIGQRLAKRLNCEFIDLDWVIEERQGRRISDIFHNEGEDAFREIEREILHKVCEEETEKATQNAVIALGGGTPCFFDNMDFVNKYGKSVYIKAEIETLITHIRMGGNRPLLDGMNDTEMAEFIGKGLALRESFYQKATYVLEIETLRTEEQIEDVAEKIFNLL